MMARLLVFLICLLSVPCTALAGDYVQCSEEAGHLSCNLHMAEYVGRARHMLTNGWENTITVTVSLLNGEESKTVYSESFEATQRCYLDPFESPCLILWKGAQGYQRYRDDVAFLRAISDISLVAFSFDDSLEPDNYVARVSVSVTASASRRLSALRSWFGRDYGSPSFVSSIVGARTESAAAGADGGSVDVVLDTAQFYIDMSLRSGAADGGSGAGGSDD